MTNACWIMTISLAFYLYLICISFEFFNATNMVETHCLDVMYIQIMWHMLEAVSMAFSWNIHKALMCLSCYSYSLSEEYLLLNQQLFSVFINVKKNEILNLYLYSTSCLTFTWSCIWKKIIHLLINGTELNCINC